MAFKLYMMRNIFTDSRLCHLFGKQFVMSQSTIFKGLQGKNCDLSEVQCSYYLLVVSIKFVFT